MKRNFDRQFPMVGFDVFIDKTLKQLNIAIKTLL